MNKELMNVLKFFEKFYLKNVFIFATENKKTNTEYDINQHNAFFTKDNSIFYKKIKSIIYLNNMDEILENNPQIKGFKLYELVFKLLKHHLNQQFNKDLINEANNKTNLSGEFITALEKSTRMLKKMSFSELKKIINISKEWRRLNLNINNSLIFTSILDKIKIESIWNYSQKRGTKNYKTRMYVEKELNKSFEKINYRTPYFELAYPIEEYNKKQINYDAITVKKWEILKYLLSEFKKSVKSRKKLFLEELSKETFDKEGQSELIKKYYLEKLKEIEKLRVNPESLFPTIFILERNQEKEVKL